MHLVGIDISDSRCLVVYDNISFVSMGYSLDPATWYLIRQYNGQVNVVKN